MVNSTLPNRQERLEFLDSFIRPRRNTFFAEDVCTLEISNRTTNFTREELWQLAFLDAHSAADLREEAACCPDKDQLIKQVDFLNALKTFKPEFGVQNEALQAIMPNGYIMFTNQDLPRYDYCEGLSCQLIEGDPKSGLSTVAAQTALESNFPYINIIKPADRLWQDEEDRCQYIRNMFKNAYVSRRSSVILDDLERLIDYDAVGKRYSRKILQKLMVLLRTQPPRGHELLINILCIMAVMEASKRFEPEELRQIEAAMEGQNISIGIKRLLDLITWVNPLKPDRRVAKFLEKMGQAMGWGDLRA
ncbi:hypothetical protein KR084_002910 [Drosophila pseudotakahashii]|nr:hypothetical protein KR084_002910 [Drosophila pseudotakahashii]